MQPLRELRASRSAAPAPGGRRRRKPSDCAFTLPLVPLGVRQMLRLPRSPASCSWDGPLLSPPGSRSR